jgi:hypothetical protein
MNLIKLLFLLPMMAINGYIQIQDEVGRRFSIPLYASVGDAILQTTDTSSGVDDHDVSELQSDSAVIIMESEVFYYLEFWPDGSLKVKAAVEPVLAPATLYSEDLETGEKKVSFFGLPSCRLNGKFLKFNEGDSIPRAEKVFRHGRNSDGFEFKLGEKIWKREIVREGRRYYYVEFWPTGKLKIKAEVEPSFEYLHNIGSDKMSGLVRYKPWYQFHGKYMEYDEKGELMSWYELKHGRGPGMY